MLTILKNRVYLGEVGWRGEWHEGAHEALVDPAVLDKAQGLLYERGEDAAKRAAHGSDYLLTGLVVCACGARFTGTAATGRHRTYRYYTCGACQRYGTSTCQAARLPADVLDEAIVASLLQVLSDGALIDEAVRCRAHEHSAASEHLVEGELEATGRELSEVEAAIERYLTSFERGSLPEEVCGPRVRALGERAGKLRERQAELSTTLEEEALQAPDPAGLSSLRGEVEAAMRSGSPAQVKALLQALVHEVRVEDASTVRPVFKIPAGTATTCSEAVRAPSRVVVLTCHSTRPPSTARSSAFAQVDGPVLQLPPLGTVLRPSPGEPPVRPTAPLVTTLPIQRRLGPDEVTELVASYRRVSPWRSWPHRSRSTGRLSSGTSGAMGSPSGTAGRSDRTTSKGP